MNQYIEFIRANSEYLSRADESGLDITDDLTIGCWVYFDPESTDENTGIVGKWYIGIGNQASYLLYKDSNNKITFSISRDGLEIFSVDDGGVNYAEGQWFYVVGKYSPSTEIDLFVNGMWYRKTTDVPAAIFNSTTDFEIGRYNATNYLDGRVSHAFLSNYYIPDRFICAMYAHAKSLYMNRFAYANHCSSSSSSTSSSSSSSSSSTTSSSSSSVPP